MFRGVLASAVCSWLCPRRLCDLAIFYSSLSLFLAAQPHRLVVSVVPAPSERGAPPSGTTPRGAVLFTQSASADRRLRLSSLHPIGWLAKSCLVKFVVPCEMMV